MKTVFSRLNARFVLAILALVWPWAAYSVQEWRFDLLQIGAHTYTNVTLTPRSQDYVMMEHSYGMARLKVGQLPPELRQLLGYGAERSSSNSVASWAQAGLAKIHLSKPDQVRALLPGRISEKIPPNGSVLSLLSLQVVGIALFIALGLHLFFSYCCMLVCMHAGSKPGALVWIPVVQLVPLLKAAGMSPWWLVAFFLPIVNLVAGAVWAWKIAKACGRSEFFGILLLVPVANILAFLALAFQKGSKKLAQEVPRDREIMALEVT